MSGRGEHGFRRIAVNQARADVRAELRSTLLARLRRPVRTRLKPGVLAVGRREQPPGGGHVGAGQSARVPGAVEPLVMLDGDRAPNAGASAAEDASIRSVRYGCIRTRSSFPDGVSGPLGLSQMLLGTPSLPRSWTSAARRSCVDC